MPRLRIPEFTEFERADLSGLPRQELEDLAWRFRELARTLANRWARTRRPVRDRLRATIPTGAIREAARIRWARGVTVAPARTPPRRAARPKTRTTRTRRRRSREAGGGVCRGTGGGSRSW